MINWKQRYSAAHQKFQQINYPASFKDHGSLPTQYPDVSTSNGLTRMVLYFLKWEGWRSTRVSSSGRIVKAPEKQESGISLMTSKYIPGTTRRGAADVSATIKGRSCMFEIKVGNDKPRPEQIREQEIERSAGGQYEFIYTPDQFLEWYDQFLLSLK